ncbi:hypothetical protein BHF71_06560 [Vulcanibacillus modesticaldus]|uniref:YwiC-like protein n=1 Tax=Vulcanibacillus modesticaldus TaxID=337097 RepID=A0A1D2YWE4_9BACI|nr:YwiC-like family protein [Vulcanibacillus modesticaldus]OEG00019.1 hypothetical protein BHF71_06560 [Vulcanibacillus modesticaldus]
MKIILPKEHGAWAMWIAPFIIGATLSQFKWLHVILFFSIFFLYISISPFLQGIRQPRDRKQMWKYAVTYLVIGTIIGIPVIINHPKLIYLSVAIISLFVNIYYIKIKKERSLLNDLISIMALTSTIFASYKVGTNYVDSSILNKTIVNVWILNILFFFGSALYVKSLVREKDNHSFKIFANLYMLLLPIIGYMVGDIYVGLAFVLSFLRMLYSHRKNNLSIRKIGIIEIINTIWFVVFLILRYYA